MAAAAKQKDPRKVAAGQAGAATRKAKKEQLESELRKATYNQVGGENSKTPETTKTTPDNTEKRYSGGSEKGWAIGIAAALVLAYFTYAKRAPEKQPPTANHAPEKQSPPPAAAPTQEEPKPVKQLKVTQDPFHME